MEDNHDINGPDKSEANARPHTISVVSPPQYQGLEPDAADFLPTIKQAPSRFELMPPHGSALPGAIFLGVITAGSMLRWNVDSMEAMFDVSRASIVEKHEYWRLITAILGHGDLNHLLHNLPVFLFFAWILHGYFGILVSIVSPLVIGVLSNYLTVIFYDEHARLLGASGMIYGMAAMWLVLYVHFDKRNWWVKRVMRAVGFTLLVLFPQTYDPNVSYLAHFSGYLSGLGMGGMLIPYARKYSPVSKLEREA